MGLGCPEDTYQECGCRFPVAMIHLLNDSPFTLYIILLYPSYIRYSKGKQRSHIDGLVQDCGNSSALAVKLPQSCTKPSIWGWTFCQWFINLLLWSPSFLVSVCDTVIKPLSAHEMGTQSLVDTACWDYMETTCNSCQNFSHLIPVDKRNYIHPMWLFNWSIYQNIRNMTIETWWHHQMETFSTLLAIFAGNSLVPGEFPTQRPVTWIFDVFFDLRLNRQLSKQWWGWWFEKLSHPLWCHCNEILFCLH